MKECRGRSGEVSTVIFTQKKNRGSFLRVLSYDTEMNRKRLNRIYVSLIDRGPMPGKQANPKSVSLAVLISA